MRNFYTLAAALGSALLVSNFAFAQNVTGAGATFPAPIYAKWADSYSKATGAKINYQSVGSGAGIKQIKGKTVDFGASDAPLSDEELQKEGMVQFPTVIGGIVPVINVAGVAPGQLKLTGDVLADIFLGKVAKWNAPAIASLNPGMKLPDADIAVVRRADGSGTSFVFTTYLSKVNAEWKSKVGAGTAVNWPTGAGGKGNEGVSAFVQRLPNSIGYVEYAYAKQNKMNYVQLRNASNTYVSPDDLTFKAAAAGADWNRTFSQDLTDKPGKDSWPITSATYIIMYKSADKPEVSSAALKFFEWAYQNGDKSAEELEFVPLPAAVKDLVRKQWASQMKDASGKPIAFK